LCSEFLEHVREITDRLKILVSGVQLSLCPLVASFSDLMTCTPVRLRTERPDDSKNAGRLLDWSVGRCPDYPSESGLQASQTLRPNGVVAPCPPSWPDRGLGSSPGPGGYPTCGK